jgi:DNA-binding response OmpR family regulator
MRLLLVEDDFRLGPRLRRTLGDAGIIVDLARDGGEALAAATATPFDVVVLDVILPGASGFEVCRTLRQRRFAAPILMLTAKDSVEDRVKGLEAGADDYLVKPFDVRELLARVRALARRHLPERNKILRVGRITLDTGAHLCFVDEKPLELTAREYSVLEHFMHFPGQLFTRGQVIEHVWTYDFAGGQNLIEVYVWRLRQKLIAAGAGDPFVTVRGAGYRLVAQA